MSLDKAISYGKEHRKPYHGAKAVDSTCRNHGSCDYCKNNRLFSVHKHKEAADFRLKEYASFICGGDNSAADYFYSLRPVSSFFAVNKYVRSRISPMMSVSKLLKF